MAWDTAEASLPGRMVPSLASSPRSAGIQSGCSEGDKGESGRKDERGKRGPDRLGSGSIYSVCYTVGISSDHVTHPGLKSSLAPCCPQPNVQTPCLDLQPLQPPSFTTWSSMNCLQSPKCLLPYAFALAVASGEAAIPCSSPCPVNSFASFRTQLHSRSLTHPPLEPRLSLAQSPLFCHFCPSNANLV